MRNDFWKCAKGCGKWRVSYRTELCEACLKKVFPEFSQADVDKWRGKFGALPKAAGSPTPTRRSRRASNSKT